MKEPLPEKIDEAVLGLLYLTSFRERKDFPWRAWKGHDWDAMDRLCEKGLISNPVGKAKSITFTEDGYRQAEAAFDRLFCGKKPRD